MSNNEPVPADCEECLAMVVEANKALFDEKLALQIEKESLATRNAELEAALEHYANIHNWDDEYVGSFARYKAGPFGTDVAEKVLSTPSPGVGDTSVAPSGIIDVVRAAVAYDEASSIPTGTSIAFSDDTDEKRARAEQDLFDAVEKLPQAVRDSLLKGENNVV